MAKNNSVYGSEKNNELSEGEFSVSKMSELDQASHAISTSISINLNDETIKAQESSVLEDHRSDSSSSHEIVIERTGSGVHEDVNEESTDKPISSLKKCQKSSSNEYCCCSCCCQPSSDSALQVWSLLRSSRSLLKLKDFRSEVRASMDVEQFVHQSELMLDLVEVSVQGIVTAMLKKVSFACDD